MALRFIKSETLWKRAVADGATAIMGGGGNGNRNQFVPGATPGITPGTWAQGTNQAGSLLQSAMMKINVGTDATDRLFIVGAFKPSAVSGTQSLVVTASKIQAIAFGMTKHDRTNALWTELALVQNNLEVPETDRQLYFGQELYIVSNDQETSAPRMGGVAANPPDVVLNGGFFYAPTAATITVANAIGKTTQWEFEVTRRPSGATRAASEATAYPITRPGVGGLGLIRLVLSMTNSATAAFADNTTATLDGEILALHFREV